MGSFAGRDRYRDKGLGRRAGVGGAKRLGVSNGGQQERSFRPGCLATRLTAATGFRAETRSPERPSPGHQRCR
jgi:hypothetical protein